MSLLWPLRKTFHNYMVLLGNDLVFLLVDTGNMGSFGEPVFLPVLTPISDIPVKVAEVRSRPPIMCAAFLLTSAFLAHCVFALFGLCLRVLALWFLLVALLASLDHINVCHKLRQHYGVFQGSHLGNAAEKAGGTCAST